MLPYSEHLSESENLARLADHLEGQIRNLDALPSRASEVAELRIKAQAASEGYLVHDSRSISGCDRTTQVWRAKLGAVGRVVRPDQYWPDGKAPKREPIKVVRGR